MTQQERPRWGSATVLVVQDVPRSVEHYRDRDQAARRLRRRQRLRPGRRRAVRGADGNHLRFGMGSKAASA